MEIILCSIPKWIIKHSNLNQMFYQGSECSLRKTECGLWSHGTVIPKSKGQIINRKLVGVSGGRGTAATSQSASPCLNTTDTAAAAEGEEQYFNWDKRQQRLLLGSYFESNTTAQCCHQAEVIVQSWGPRRDSSTVITFMCTCATTGEGWIR